MQRGNSNFEEREAKDLGVLQWFIKVPHLILPQHYTHKSFVNGLGTLLFQRTYMMTFMNVSEAWAWILNVWEGEGSNTILQNEKFLYMDIHR